MALLYSSCGRVPFSRGVPRALSSRIRRPSQWNPGIQSQETPPRQ
ncbi:hypothetical protein ACTODO_00228 [Schaalia dentiphila ATCC 17982]|uniref:Uncharacterized protein n=1 Tax=Schaalia dentiphila ATCC 17982 TaxID=411466 RepID=A7B9C6_9ACTO|nr:hypothetical protein ACTODO_00228 [Schaalia odontolytica ATCC 17982]